MSNKIKEPPKEGKPPRNIKFLNPLLLWEAYQIMKMENLLKGRLAWKALTSHNNTFQNKHYLGMM